MIVKSEQERKVFFSQIIVLQARDTEEIAKRAKISLTF